MAKFFCTSMLATLAFAMLIQNTYSRTIQPTTTNYENLTYKDKYAQEASDALDSALMSIRNGLADLIDDGQKLNSIFIRMSESVGKLILLGFNQTSTEMDPGLQLRQLNMKANKTLIDML